VPAAGVNASRARYSSIVIDAASGTVLSEYNADAQTYPASLTKMMTLYLTFDALERKALAAEQSLPVSVHAANQEPTKIDLVAGEEVTVRNLILGLVTQSANDAAVVLAEGLAGSEPAFAARMTDTAHALGMDGTNFANASGLPNDEQVTTARDLAKLARALNRDFPRQYRFFATEEFVFRGETITNHNHLMKTFAGMDGIKTGFIRASGYNLAASAVRDGRRLIGVVMGGKSAIARDVRMAALLNDGFARSGPDRIGALAATTDTAESQSLTAKAGRTLRNLSPVSPAEAAQPRLRSGDMASSGDNWSIQVGAFLQRAPAQRAAEEALAKLPADAGKSIAVLEPDKAAKERYYRARIVSFTERDAERACQTLHKAHKACAVMPPSTVHMASR